MVGENVNIVISNSSPKPIYEQITAQIKRMVLSGQLSPGEALPSMRFLAKELHISVITTKRAYEDLERDGYIETVPGKGCFVAEKNKEAAQQEHAQEVQQMLCQAAALAQTAGITLQEAQDMLNRAWEGTPFHKAVGK